MMAEFKEVYNAFCLGNSGNYWGRRIYETLISGSQNRSVVPNCPSINGICPVTEQDHGVVLDSSCIPEVESILLEKSKFTSTRSSKRQRIKVYNPTVLGWLFFTGIPSLVKVFVVSMFLYLPLHFLDQEAVPGAVDVFTDNGVPISTALLDDILLEDEPVDNLPPSAPAGLRLIKEE